MKQEKIKVLFVNSKASKPSDKFVYQEINNNIQEFYKMIGCRTIDIPSRKIGGTRFDFIVDDEFLLKINDEENSIPSVVLFDVLGNIQEIFFGNVIICNHDDQGETIGLSVQEAKKIINNITKIYDRENNEYYVIKTTL